VFCIFRKGVSHHQFLSELNNLHGNLSFTVEVGGATMPFLDMQITLENDRFHSSVFRKKTDTGVLLHYHSTAPTRWKTGLIKCFLHRAATVCSDQPGLNKEVDRLREIFHKNGYPKPFFDKVTNQYFRGEAKEQDQVKSPRLSLKVPYVGKPTLLFSNKMKKVIKSQVGEDLRIIYQTEKVGNQFVLKDKTPKAILSKVVYLFQCPSDLDTQYVGYTIRALEERVKDHRRGDTAVAEHVVSCKNCTLKTINVDNFSI
jgi:hypothetical protein